MKTKAPRKRSVHQSRQEETDDLIERIVSERLAALEKAVDFSLIRGAPEWVIRLVLPDAQPLLSKHPKYWQPAEIQLLQESINTLPFRMLAAMSVEPTVV